MIDFRKNLGMALLAVFLILIGLGSLFDLKFNAKPVVEGILALVAGILLLLGR